MSKIEDLERTATLVQKMHRFKQRGRGPFREVLCEQS